MRAVSRCSLTAAVMLICLAATTAAADTRAHARPTPVRAIASSLPTLRNAVVLATLVAIDPKSDLAEFRTRCGWYIKLVGKEQYVRPRSKVRLKEWKLSLRGLSFDFETYPNGPISGINHPESLKQWERHAVAFGWSGSVHLFPLRGWGRGSVGDGPTTDVCAGVLG